MRLLTMFCKNFRFPEKLEEVLHAARVCADERGRNVEFVFGFVSLPIDCESLHMFIS